MTPSRFRQVEALRAVLRTGSVTRAAEALSLSQPAVTKLLRNLEDETGLALFDRTRRRLVATTEAAQCEAEIERLFSAADRLDRTIEDLRSVGRGVLRVAAMPILGISLLPRLLAQFARKTKPARVSLSVGPSRDVHDIVEAGDADLGFALPFGSRTALVAAPQIRMPGLLVLPRGHRLAANHVVTLKDLEGEPYISLGRQNRLSDLVDDLFARNDVTPRLVAETQSAAAACCMAAAGLGFVIADPVSIESVVTETEVRRLEPTVTFAVDVLAPPGRPMSIMTKRFLQTVLAELANARFGVSAV